MRQADIIEDKLDVPSLRAAFSSFLYAMMYFVVLELTENEIISYLIRVVVQILRWLIDNKITSTLTLLSQSILPYANFKIGNAMLCMVPCNLKD